MDLERVAVRLRPRNGWESVDLGLALAHRFWRPVYGRWLALTLPAAALLVGLGGAYGLLLYWWLLPLFEAVVLFVVSRAVFGATPSARATLLALPALWRRLLPELLLRRFHPGRSLYFPVGQLEALSGEARRQRCAVLAGGQDVAGFLPFIFLVFELGLSLALVVLGMLMIPSALGVDWELLVDRLFDGTLSRGGYAICWALLVAANAALHPLYVQSGFALYLNRRTELEGWDLEIVFRRLAQRVAAQGGVGVSSEVAPVEAAPAETASAETASAETASAEAASAETASAETASAETASAETVPIETAPAEAQGEGQGETGLAVARMVALLLMLSLPGAGLSAQPDDPRVQPADEPVAASDVPAAASNGSAPEIAPAAWSGDPERDPRRLIQEVLARPELQRRATIVRWRLRSDLLEGLDDDNDEPVSLPGLVWLARGLAMLGEPLLWLLAALVLGLLLRAMWRRLEDLDGPDRPSRLAAPQRIAGLDLRPESLPDDIPAAAAALWDEGRPAASLSLLYRGALGRLAAEGLELRESFTEDDCLRSAGAELETARLGFFTELTRNWQRLAYAHRTPSGGEAQRLWQGWREHFGGGG